MWHALNVRLLNSDPCKHLGAEKLSKSVSGRFGGAGVGGGFGELPCVRAQLHLIKKSFRAGGDPAKVRVQASISPIGHLVGRGLFAVCGWRWKDDSAEMRRWACSGGGVFQRRSMPAVNEAV